MKTAIVLLNFGEPESADPEEVASFLEGIFLANASLEGGRSPEETRARARSLAEARAPALAEEYKSLGGSPLNRQAHEQARLLTKLLRRRGHDVEGVVGMQFTRPSIPDAVRKAKEAGARGIVALPVYPLPGPSTTRAALRTFREAVKGEAWRGTIGEIPIWHRHPTYVQLRANAIRRTAREAGVELEDPGTVLVFSAHGTPLHYLRAGSPYLQHARELCRALWENLGEPRYRVGFQNHDHRPGVKWTEPSVESVIDELRRDPTVATVVVEPVSFMHEQSETLVELDRDLRQEAREGGLRFHRVPIPHASRPFIRLLASRVEAFLQRDAAQNALDAAARPERASAPGGPEDGPGGPTELASTGSASPLRGRSGWKPNW